MAMKIKTRFKRKFGEYKKKYKVKRLQGKQLQIIREKALFKARKKWAKIRAEREARMEAVRKFKKKYPPKVGFTRALGLSKPEKNYTGAGISKSVGVDRRKRRRQLIGRRPRRRDVIEPFGFGEW